MTFVGAEKFSEIYITLRYCIILAASYYCVLLYLEMTLLSKLNGCKKLFGCDIIIIFICVPPIGRFEDDFINSRLRQLQLWIDRMCNHPVIAQSEVFVHFLSCTEDKVCLKPFRSEQDVWAPGRLGAGACASEILGVGQLSNVYA